MRKIQVDTPQGVAIAEEITVKLSQIHESLAPDSRRVIWRFSLLRGTESIATTRMGFTPREDIEAALGYWAKCQTPEGNAEHIALCERLADEIRKQS